MAHSPKKSAWRHFVKIQEIYKRPLYMESWPFDERETLLNYWKAEGHRKQSGADGGMHAANTRFLQMRCCGCNAISALSLRLFLPTALALIGPEMTNDLLSL